MDWAATCSARRVLPTPPMPTRVTRRLASSSARSSPIARARPTNERSDSGRLFGMSAGCSTGSRLDCETETRRARENSGASGAAPRQRLLEALLARERVFPAVARAREPLDRVGEAEIERVRPRELVPGERHGYRGARLAARRVRDIQRLAAHVHVVVHENLSGALRYLPLERDVLRVLRHEVAADHLGDVACVVEGERAADRHEDVEPRLARGLHHRLERHAREELPQVEGDLLALLEGGGVELGLRARRLLPRI